MKTKTELLAQLDRVTAERDAALAELKRYQSLFNQAQRAIDRLNELHPKRMAELGRRLTAADERADVLEGLLREVQVLITAEPFGVLSGMGDQSKRMAWYDKVSPVRERIDAALKPEKMLPADHKCIECESEYCHGVCVERGDSDDRLIG